MGSDCSIQCENCGNRACEDALEHCSDGTLCTHCINEAKEDEDNEDEDDYEYRRRWNPYQWNPMESIPWEDEWDAPFEQQCAWVQMTRRPLSYERCHRLASADSPIGGLCMKHLKLYRNLERERIIADEGYDPWQEAEDETRQGRHNPFWDRAKGFVKGSMRLGGKMIPFMNVPPSVVRNFGSWALDYVIPRPVRDEFLRKLDAHLHLGRETCLRELGPEECQKVENAAIALGKKWADTSRSVEEWMGRDGQFDATLDLFNQEMARALDKRRR